MIMWITSGLIVLDEKKFYSWLELAGILGSIVLSLIGIKFLSMKRKLIKIEAKRERASSLSSQYTESEMTPKDQNQRKQMMLKKEQEGRVIGQQVWFKSFQALIETLKWLNISKTKLIVIKNVVRI